MDSMIYLVKKMQKSVPIRINNSFQNFAFTIKIWVVQYQKLSLFEKNSIKG